MRLRTEHLRPSVVARASQFFGTYDRAVALLAIDYPRPASVTMQDPSPSDSAVMLIADLYGVEPGQVAHDVREARKREHTHRPTRSVQKARRLSLS